MIEIIIFLAVFFIFLLFISYLISRFIWFFNPIFNFLNWLQWWLYNPLSFLFKNRRANYPRGLFLISWITLIQPIYFVTIHIYTTPLRFINALYFNIILFWSLHFHDSLLDVLNPKMGSYRYQTGFTYLFHWLYAFPFRLIIFILKNSVMVVSSIFWTIFDTVFITYTMYHGTTFAGIATDIVKQNRWYVGNGDYAGTGIYFGLNKKVAEHYSQDAIIVARVFLFPCRNATTLPKILKSKLMGNDGDGLAKDISFPWASIEHWREDTKWFEYCILKPNMKEQYVKTARVRAIAVLKNGKLARIWER